MTITLMQFLLFYLASGVLVAISGRETVYEKKGGRIQNELTFLFMILFWFPVFFYNAVRSILPSKDPKDLPPMTTD